MAYDFKQRLKPQGYFDKVDDSFLEVFGLVNGTHDVLINDEGKTVWRKGMTRLGVAGTSVKGIEKAYTWQTSTNSEIALRCPYDGVQVLRDGVWRFVLTGQKINNAFRFKPWWDRAEIKDKLLGVNGTTNVFSWTGGMAEIASWTSTTITKKYAKASTAGNTFTFNAAARTLTQSTATDFITLGFVADQYVTIAGTTSNNGLFKILSVTTNVITFSADSIITNETPAAGALIGVKGRETWAAERFATTGTLTVNINGNIFTYNAGWNTPTLTLTADPSASCSVGLFVFQPFASSAPTGGDFQAGQLIDILEVNLNQAFYSHTQSRNVYIATQTNYLSCAYTGTIRKVGEGGTIFLDNNAVGIAATNELTQISAGTSDIYNVTFEAFSDGTTSGELIRVKKQQTAYGQGAVSQDCFVKIKNGMAYVSQEPTIDFLGNVENLVTQQSKPLSDPIKRLLNRIDRSRVEGLYHKNNLYYLFTNASVMLVYNVEAGFWQPPQTVSGNCMSIIGGVLCVHSNFTDETYTMFTGLTDNGKPISRAVYTNIDTYGNRIENKIYDELYIEVLVNGSATAVQGNLAMGYQGSVGLQPFTFGFNDSDNFVETPQLPSGMGMSAIGQGPLGSMFTDYTLDPEIGPLKKLYKILSTNIQQARTHQMQFFDDKEGSYCEIISFGVNTRLANDNNMDIKE
jgi:hypothetical protein